MAKRFLLAQLILLCALRGYGAVTIKQANVEASGWVLNVTVGSNDTNGGFNFGFGTNNSGASAIVLSVTSQGYSDTGTATTIARTVYATKQLRYPYPNQTNNDATASGADVIIRMALNDYVYSGDSNITMTASANWYSNNVPATNAMTVVNNSTAAHPKVIANWSWPGWQKVSANSMTLRTVGFHRSGQQGRPLRAMRFVAQDQHSHAVTNFVTAMTIDSTVGDAVPVCEYVTSMDISTFTQSDFVRCDFTAYPWVGDSGAVLDTFANVNTQPTPFPASITNVCDRLGTYSTAIAVVDPAGNDTNGRVSTNSDPTLIGSGQYFLTIGKAANQIAASNNVAGSPTHNDCGGGVIYIKAGSYTFAGAATTYGAATSPAWLTIMPYPGVSRETAIIGSNSGDRLLGNSKIHLYGMTLTNNSALEFLSVPYLWVDNMILNHQTGTTFDGTEYEYFTGNRWTNVVGGVSYIAGQVKVPVLVRGNSFTNSALSGGGSAAIFCYTVLGNLLDFRGVASGYGSTIFSMDIGGQPIVNSTNPIVAFNKVLGLNTSIPQLNAGVVSNNLNGAAFVQNLFEKTTSSSSQPLFQVAGNGAADNVSNYNNVICWYNTGEGDRFNLAYDASGTSNRVRSFWSFNKNITGSSYNIKGDVYAGFDVADGSRIGNWPVLWGVGFDGNGITAITTAFVNEFAGLNSTMTNFNSSGTVGPTQPVGYWKYTATGGYDGTSTNAGNGNYRLLGTSPAILPSLSSSGWYGLPYDIEGNARGGFDPPGAYSSASPRKGGGFFAQ